jgi:hypothetical protein
MNLALTKRLERLKVNLGAVLRTRINTGDSAIGTSVSEVQVAGDGLGAHAQKLTELKE